MSAVSNRLEEIEAAEQITEVFSKNKVDDDIQAILKPLNILQLIYFRPKYKIRNGYITPIGYVHKIINFISNVFFVLLFIISTFYKSYLTFVLSQILHAFTLIINYLISLKHANENIQLVLKIQDVNRALKLKRVLLKTFVVWNWIWIIAFTCVIVLIYILSHLCFSYFSLLEILMDIVLLGLDMNVIYAVRVFKIITMSLRKWHEDMTKMIYNDFQNIRDTENVYKSYSNILDAYCLFTKVSQETVSHLTVMINQYFC